MTAPAPIDRLRAALLADEALQRDLAPLGDAPVFADRAAAIAAGLGLPVSSEMLAAGLARAASPQAQLGLPALRLGEAPPRHWLPVDLKRHDGTIVVEWLHFAGAPLAEPFFEESIRRARALPFNALMRCATPLAALDGFAAAPPPDGLVFHMSRCGSTLVAQMLAAVPGHAVVSEPPLLDLMIRLVGRGSVAPAAVAALFGALTRDRGDGARRRFVKLDAWHAFALPMLRTLWPDTPWVFLYRDPVEVLVSQARRPGMHVRPGVLPLDAYGVRGAEEVAPGDYAAWVLEHICAAALDAAANDPHALLVDYRELPAAAIERIAPHFGIDLDAPARAAMDAAGGRYSKAPDRVFTSDSDAKQREATDAQRAAAARGLAAVCARLDAARLAA